MEPMMANNPVRTIFVSVKTFLMGTQAPRSIRFSGVVFKELRERLASVNLPGAGNESCFVEVRMEDGRYMCLLDGDQLPEGDLYVTVHNYSEGER
jgi:hypothetical protein